MKNRFLVIGLIGGCAVLLVVLVFVGVLWMFGGHEPKGGGGDVPGQVEAGGAKVTKPVRPEFERVTDEQGATRVYANGFLSERAVGTEWSDSRIGLTPKGDRPYLGDFVEEPVELSLDSLPPHKLLRITFDLYLMRCWDGSAKFWGEKIWDLDIVGGQNLIHTTFSNAGFFSDNNEQAFPDTFPCRPLPAWTGAAEKQTLGTIQSWGGASRTFDASGVYHFALAFPHNDSKVDFRFLATMRKTHDKSWGLANVKVETIPEFTHFSDEDLARLWKTVGDTHAIKAFPALWELATAGDQATAYIEPHLKESNQASREEVAKWAGQLESDDKDESAAAITNLIAQGAAGLPMIQAAANGPATNQITVRTVTPGLSAAKGRMNFVLNYIAKYPESATELRNHRAKHLLGVIGTPRAVALAATIVGHPDDSLEKKGP